MYLFLKADLYSVKTTLNVLWIRIPDLSPQSKSGYALYRLPTWWYISLCLFIEKTVLNSTNATKDNNKIDLILHRLLYCLEFSLFHWLMHAVFGQPTNLNINSVPCVHAHGKRKFQQMFVTVWHSKTRMCMCNYKFSNITGLMREQKLRVVCILCITSTWMSEQTMQQSQSMVHWTGVCTVKFVLMRLSVISGPNTYICNYIRKLMKTERLSNI